MESLCKKKEEADGAVFCNLPEAEGEIHSFKPASVSDSILRKYKLFRKEISKLRNVFPINVTKNMGNVPRMFVKLFSVP